MNQPGYVTCSESFTDSLKSMDCPDVQPDYAKAHNKQCEQYKQANICYSL